MRSYSDEDSRIHSNRLGLIMNRKFKIASIGVGVVALISGGALSASATTFYPSSGSYSATCSTRYMAPHANFSVGANFENEIDADSPHKLGTYNKGFHALSTNIHNGTYYFIAASSASSIGNDCLN